MTKCRISFSGHCDLDHELCPSLKKCCVWGISRTFFEVGIPNLVCGCIYGMTECGVPFLGHCDLGFDLWPIFRIIVFGAYLLYHLR